MARSTHFDRIRNLRETGPAGLILSLLCLLLAAGCSDDPVGPSLAPDPPGDLTITARGTGALMLTWTDNSDNEEGFRIRRRDTPDGPLLEVGHTAAETSSYLDTGLEPDSEYHYDVIAWNSTANSSRSAVGFGRTLAADDGVPALGLGVDSITFQVEEGQLPSSQSSYLDITNLGGGILNGLELEVAYLSGHSGWLAGVHLPSTTAPTRIEVRPSSVILPPGTHEARLSVSSPSASNSPVHCDVQLIVAQDDAPRIGLSPDQATFSGMAGGPRTSEQHVTVTNAGGGVLIGLQLGDFDDAWLSADLDGSTAPTTINLRCYPIGLTEGTYTETIPVRSMSASVPDAHISVTFTVGPPPEGPDLQSAVVNDDQITLTWSFDWPYMSISNESYFLEESSAASNWEFTEIDRFYTRTSPYSTTLERSPGTYRYRVRALTCLGVTRYSEIRSAVVEEPQTQTRSLRITNHVNPDQYLDEVVQMKIVPVGGTFTEADLLATDNRCWRLSQSSIGYGESATFEVTVGQNYWVMIGMGKWQMDLTYLNCSSVMPWWEMRYFTAPNYDTYYSWVAVNVTDHESGEWEWTITGSYTTGNLVVTPAGNGYIPFNNTPGDPLAGKAVCGESTIPFVDAIAP